MPFDGGGKHFINPQKAKFADKVRQPKAPHEPKSMAEEAPKPDDGQQDKVTMLHDHGDGTFHTESEDGERTDHADIHDAIAHIAEKHSGQSDPMGQDDSQMQDQGDEHSNPKSYHHLSGM